MGKMSKILIADISILEILGIFGSEEGFVKG